jgi:hypothetical protein
MGEILLKILRHYKGLIICSLLLSLALGAAAAIYPISFVAHLRIPNNEGFFSLTELKRVKNLLPIEARPLIDQETDPALKEYLEKSALEPKWIEKNITPTIALTKADLKDSPQSQQEKIDAQSVVWLNAETTSKKEAVAIKSARWLGELICKINFKESINGYVASIRGAADGALQGIYGQLPGIEKSIDQMQENIKNSAGYKSKIPRGNDRIIAAST